MMTNKAGWAWLKSAVNKHFFLIGMAIAIGVAGAYPSPGAKDGALEPDITTGWVAIMVVFFLSGWSIKTRDLALAMTRIRLNFTTQLFIFGLASSVVVAVAEILRATRAVGDALADGLAITGCLPTTVSMCVILNVSAGGDNPAGIFNSAFSNLAGVFLTPLIVLMFIGNKSTVPFQDILLKLTIKILVPLVAGQFVQAVGGRPFYVRNKELFKKAQELLLVLIVYTTFCKTFSSHRAASYEQLAVMFGTIVPLYVLLLVLAFGVGSVKCFPGPFTRKERVMLLFCGTHKTIAMGIPMINTMFEGSKDIGLYIVPLIIWHPLQLIVGSFLIHPLKKWIAHEEESGTTLQNTTTVVQGPEIEPQTNP